MSVSNKTKSFEREALAGLCAHLSSNGLPSMVMSHPEDDPNDPLTVDARLDIAGMAFAADHSRVQYDNRRIPAERAAEQYLLPKLDEISNQTGYLLHVQMCAPRWNRGTIKPVTRYDEIIALASRAASYRKTLKQGATRVVVQPGGPGKSSLSFFAEDDPLVETQVELGLHDVLDSKLTGQLKRAKESGEQVLLLLDQVPERDGDGTLWLAVGGTVQIVVKRLLNLHPGVVDQVWLRGPNGKYLRIYPEKSLLQ